MPKLLISRRILLIAGGLCLLLGTCLLAVLHLPAVQNRVFGFLASRALPDGMVVEAAGFRYNLLQGTAEIRGLKVGTSVTEPEPLARISFMAIRFHPLKLMRGLEAVESIHIKDPALSFEFSAERETNLPAARPSTRFEWNSLPSEISIEGGSLHLQDSAHAWELRIRGLSMDITAAGGGRDVRMAILEKGSLQLPRGSLPLQEIRFGGRLASSDLEVREFEARIGGSRFSARGWIRNLASPELELSLASHCDLADVSGLLSRDIAIAGSLAVEAEIAGPAREATADIAARYSELRVAELDRLSGTADLQYRHSSSELILEDLQVRSSLGGLSAAGSLLFSEKGSEGQLRADLKNVRLAGVMARLGYASHLAALVSGPVSLSWKKPDWRAAAGRARLTLAPEGSGPIPLGGPVDLTLDARVLRIHAPAVSGPGFHMAADLRTDILLDRLDGTVRGEIGDAAALLEAARRAWPQPMSRVAIPFARSIRWDARLDGSVRMPRIVAAIKASDVVAGSFDGIGFDGVAEYEAGRLRLHDSSLSWRSRLARIGGELDLSAAGSPVFDLQAGLQDAPLQEVLTGLGLELQADGSVSAHLEGRGSLSQPEFEASASVTGLSAFGERFGSLNASARLAGSRIIVDSLSLEKPQQGGRGLLEGHGTLDWGADLLDFEVRSSPLAIESMVLPDQVPIRGRLSLQAGASGSLSKPAWSVRLNGETLSVAGRSIGDFSGSVSGRGSAGTVEFEFPEYAANLRGEIELTPPYPARLVFDSAGLDIARLQAALPDGTRLDGSVAVRVEASGALARPEEAAAKISLRNLEAGVAGYRIRSRSGFEAEWKNQTLFIHPAQLESEVGEWRMAGQLPFGAGGGQGEVTVEGELPLSLMAHLIPAAYDVEVQGTAGIHGVLRGSLQRIRPSFEITSRDGELRMAGMPAPLTGIVIEAAVDADRIEVRRIEARLGSGAIRARGTIPLPALSGAEAPAPLRAEIELADINPAAIWEDMRTLTGSVAVHAVLEAPRVDLRSVRGTLLFPEFRLKLEDTEAEQSGQTRLKIEDGRLIIEHLALKSTGGASLESSGWVSLLEDRAVKIHISGGLDAELLSAGRRDFGLDGLIGMNLEIDGSLQNPRVNGSADFSAGRFFLAAPPLSASELSAHAQFAGNRITLTRLAGRLNEGRFEAEGSATFSKGALEDLRVKAKAGNVFLDYPQGLRTVSNLDIDVRSDKDLFLVEGTAHILEGVYGEAIDLMSLQKGFGPASSERNPLLDRIIFSVRLQTEAPVAVDNNLARLEAYADLRLVGPASRPAMLGRLELDEGGTVYVSERTFTIARAAVNFTNAKRIEPELDLSAQTRIGEYVITFNASGGLKNMEASFASDPPVSREQIDSLLLTGSPDKTDSIHSGSVASRSALSLFGSTAVGGLNMRLRRALGFSEFRITPSLISPDSDPTARLTVGQNFTPELSLTYSVNLRNSNDQIWIAGYDWRRSVVARYLNRSEDTNRGEIHQRIRFGGGPATGDLRRAGPTGAARLKSVEITGETVFPDDVIRKKLNLQPGTSFDFSEVQKRVEKLIRFYGGNGYLEAAIRQDRQRDRDGVALKLDITAGRRVSFDFEGMEVPGSVRKAIEKAWQSGIVDSERLREASALIRLRLFRGRYCDAEVAPVVAELDALKTVTFHITPGFRYDRLLLEFPGLPQGLAGDLRAVLRRNALDLQIRSDPAAVLRILENRLRERGYLTAEVSLPQVRRDQREGTYALVMPVEPGPRYRMGEFQFEGNRAVSSADLIKEFGVNPGEPYVPEQLGSLAESLIGVYWRKGYRDATAEAVELPDRASGSVDLLFRIQENPQATVGGIEVDGNVKTSEGFLRRRIPLQPGDVVNGDKIDLLRRRLTASGSYDTLDITLPPAAQPAPGSGVQPLDLVIRVREPKPFTFEYGFTYDSKRKAGLLVDARTRNVLGEGRLVGYRMVADREKIDQRIYYTQPFLGRHDIVTNADMTLENSIIDELNIYKRGLTIQQQVEFRRKFTFSYGYRFRYTKSDVGSAYAEEVISSQTTSPLLSALIRDTRDDFFDATRGSYVSQAFEYGPTFLGGNLPYYRYFGQYSRYFGLTRPAAVPFADGRRSRFVFATGVRLGLMGAMGNREFTPGDLFFGGGSTSVRGFKQNSLGPQLPDGQPVGGQAVLFLNNELRTPIYKWIDAAFFLDIGNVFEKPSDLSLFDLRRSAGIGLRLRNPFVLLRFDYGWKLDRLSGESRGAFHFGIGQAF